MAQQCIVMVEVPIPPAKPCPLFNDPRYEFCISCDLTMPPEGYIDSSNFDAMANECMRFIDVAIEELETAATVPKNIDDIVSGIIIKLDRIINARYAISGATKDTIDVIISRLVTIEKNFGELRAKLDVEIGNLYFGLRRFQKAVEWYDRATKVNPENKDAWNNRGVALVRLGKTESALRFYDLAIKIEPDYEQGWFNKGKALYKLKRIKEATRCFQRVTEINPKNICAWNNLGVLLRILGKNKQAMECYERAIKTRRDYEWAWHNKGMVLAETGKLAEALACFNKALDINPNFKPAKDALDTYEKKMFSRRGLFKRLKVGKMK